jgi:hypothetical protein
MCLINKIGELRQLEAFRPAPEKYVVQLLLIGGVLILLCAERMDGAAA